MGVNHVHGGSIPTGERGRDQDAYAFAGRRNDMSRHSEASRVRLRERKLSPRADDR